MSNPAVFSAIASHFEAIDSLPSIVWPNQEITAQPPYLIWDDGIQDGTPITIDGEERFEYRPQVSMMVEMGAGTTATDATFWAISQAFKHGTRIEGTDGSYVAQSIQTPTPDGGYPDDHLYRRNMTLRIVSHQKI